MKKLMILAVAMMASLSVNAQVEEDTWYVTPKAGFSVADLTGKLYDPSKVDGSPTMPPCALCSASLPVLISCMRGTTTSVYR